MDTDRPTPTLIHEPTPSVSSRDSLDVSKAAVGFVAGGRPKFSDETAGLLNSRLGAAALIMTFVLALAFVGNLLNGTFDLLWIRLAILAGLGACLIALSRGTAFSLRQLRLFELAIFGAVLLQLSLMLSSRLAGFAI